MFSFHVSNAYYIEIVEFKFININRTDTNPIFRFFYIIKYKYYDKILYNVNIIQSSN